MSTIEINIKQPNFIIVSPTSQFIQNENKRLNCACKADQQTAQILIDKSGHNLHQNDSKQMENFNPYNILMAGDLRLNFFTKQTVVR